MFTTRYVLGPHIIQISFVFKRLISYSNKYPTRCNVTQCILSGNCSTCLGVTTTHHQERKELYLQHLVFVTPLLLPSAIAAVLVETAVSSKPAHQTVIYTELHIPDVVLIQSILLMMGTWLPETCRE